MTVIQRQNSWRRRWSCRDSTLTQSTFASRYLRRFLSCRPVTRLSCGKFVWTKRNWRRYRLTSITHRLCWTMKIWTDPASISKPTWVMTTNGWILQWQFSIVLLYTSGTIYSSKPQLYIAVYITFVTREQCVNEYQGSVLTRGGLEGCCPSTVGVLFGTAL